MKALTPMKKQTTSILKSAAIAFATLFTVGTAQAQLIADDFQNPTFAAPGNNYLGLYELNGQSGSLAPLGYVGNVDLNDFKRQVAAQPGVPANTVVRLYGDNTASVFGYNTNFEYETMSISVDLAQGDATFAALTIGSDTVASQSSGSLFQVRVQNSGDINVRGNGVGDNLATFTGVGSSAFSLSTIRVDFTNTAYDGTGTATIDLWVDNVQMDLNGASTGLSYSRSGFTDNFISFSVQHPNTTGNNSGLIDNISIIPEPSSALLLGAGVAGLALLRRRRDTTRG